MRPHASFLACLAQLTHRQRVDAFPQYSTIIFFDRPKFIPQLKTQKRVGPIRLETHVSAHGYELRPSNVGQRELVFEHASDSDDGILWERFSLMWNKLRQIYAYVKHFDTLFQSIFVVSVTF